MNTNKLVRQRAVKSLSRERGASLLEGIAYLGIAAIVVLGAVSLLTGAFSSAQSNRVAEEVVSIRTGVKKLYMGQSSGYVVGTILPILIAAKVLPTTITITGAGTAATATNSWGGAVDVAGLAGGSSFSITYNTVPQDACINIISGASGWQSIAVTGGGAPPIAFPVSPADAQAACGANGGTIVWTSL